MFEDIRLPPPKKNESFKQYFSRLGVDWSKKEQTKGMIEYQKNQSQNIKDLVFDVIFEMNKPVKSKDILHIINNKIKQNNNKIKQEIEQEIKNKIESGDIDSHEKSRQMYFNKLFEERKINEIGIRVIQKKLIELINQGIVVKIPESDYYSLSNLLNPEIKIHSKEFGLGLLWSILKRIRPQHDLLEENIQRLVECFGVYILYCFIEATRPFRYDDDNNKKEKKLPSRSLETAIVSEEKDKLTLSMLENIIDIKEMFNYFLTLIKFQLDDNQIKKIQKNRKINDIHEPNLIFFKQNAPEFFFPDLVNKDDKKSPRYEINEETIINLTKILEDKFPTSIKYLKHADKIFNMPNKEGIYNE